VWLDDKDQSGSAVAAPHTMGKKQAEHSKYHGITATSR
jgi:hypothetical protein